MEEPHKPSVRGTPAAHALYFNASFDYRIARPALRVEDLGKFSLESQAVIRSFIARFPAMAGDFATRAGVDVASWNTALGADHPSEPQPDPTTLGDDSGESGRKLYELGKRLEEGRLARREFAPFSKPLTDAMRLANREARADGRETYSLGQLVSAVLRTESNATTVFELVADKKKLHEALRWLEEQPDPAVGDFVANQVSNMTALVAKMWPSIREESRAKLERSKFDSQLEEAYTRNPDRYETPIDLASELQKPVPDGHVGFSARAGLFSLAASNEARIRRAPEVTLNHLFFALLQHGTETSHFLDRNGVDREEWRRVVDEALPRFKEGPRWPEMAQELMMNRPSAGDRVITKKLVPHDLDVSKMTQEERSEYFEVRWGNKPFVDVSWLLPVLKEEETIGYGLLAKAGITADSVKAEIALRQTRDPEWYLKRANVVEGLREGKGDPFGTGFNRRSFIDDGAVFEARLRWAPEVDFGHAFLALLVDGTDTSEYLDSVGISRSELAARIDAELPRYPAGPYFPPENKDLRQFLAAMYVGVRRGASDLRFLECLLNSEPRPVGNGENPLSGILSEYGLSHAPVRQRLRELGVEFRTDEI